MSTDSRTVILRDVAQSAGVSLRTASRVLNEDPNVAEETRRRVLSVMQELSYTPDAMARSLRAGKDATVGLIVESVADPFFAELIEAVERAADESERSVLIGSTHQDPDRERTLVEQMLQRRVSGLLLVPTSSDHGWLERAVGSTQVVLVDRPAPGLSADVVRVDDRAATASATTHLIEQGHRRIAYIGDFPTVSTSADRLEGFLSALAEHGLDADEDLVRASCPTPESAAAATNELGVDWSADRHPECGDAVLARRRTGPACVAPHRDRAGGLRGLRHGRRAPARHHGHRPFGAGRRGQRHGAAHGPARATRPAGRGVLRAGAVGPARIGGAPPMKAIEAVAGVDLGTTTAKVLIRDLEGRELARCEARTPWVTTQQGGTETSAEALTELTLSLLRRAVERADHAFAGVQVLAVAVAGLAESGVLVDRSGRPASPVIAWFDRRGAAQVLEVDALRPDFGREFVRRTGLPWDCQASIAKLLWLRSEGLTITAADRWLSIPEYVVHRLGGERVSEPSLASRTGLLDQADVTAWADGPAALGLPVSLLNPIVLAGNSIGRVRSDRLPASLQSAALTVAGHDHPVAALGVGAAGPDELFNSSGTADVLARSIPGRLTDAQREQLVGGGASAGAHVLPDTTLLLAGVRGGLVLRRVLDLLDADGDARRDELDRLALAVEDLPAGLEVSGAGPTGDDVILRVRDGASPAAIWTAATRYTAREAAAVLRKVDGGRGPARARRGLRGLDPDGQRPAGQVRAHRASRVLRGA